MSATLFVACLLAVGAVGFVVGCIYTFEKAWRIGL